MALRAWGGNAGTQWVASKMIEVHLGEIAEYAPYVAAMLKATSWFRDDLAAAERSIARACNEGSLPNLREALTIHSKLVKTCRDERVIAMLSATDASPSGETETEDRPLGSDDVGSGS